MDTEPLVMKSLPDNIDRLRAENEELRLRLAEAEETLQAIRAGAVDAFLVDAEDGKRVYTLETADRPYRIFLECMQQGALTLADNGLILFCNARLAQLLQTTRGRLTGTAFADLLPQKLTWNNLLEHGKQETARAETWLRRSDGIAVPVELTVSPLQLEHGQAVCVLVSDLTERKEHEHYRRTQEDLQHSEERFRLASAAVDGLIYDVNLATGHVWRSAKLQKLVAFTPDEAEPTRQWWWDRIHPEDRDRLVQATEKAIAEGRLVVRNEYRVRHRQGHYLYVWDQGILQLGADGTPQRVVGCTVDMSDRVKSAEQLALSKRQVEESLALLDALADKAPVGLAFLDPSFRFIRINERLAAMNGPSPAEHHGRSLAEIVPDLWPGLEPLLRRALAGESVTDEEMVGETQAAPGELRYWLVSVYPVRVQGSIIGIGLVQVEVTAQKRTEAALREADRRKNEFLAMLAHELRNPLAPIRNAVSILNLVGPKDPVLVEARELIERQVTSLVRLVDDLLDLSRVSRGKILLQKATIDLAAVVRAAVDTTRPEIDSRRHELIVDLPTRPVLVHGDFTRLNQVVGNLLQNAAKYTDTGGQIWLSLTRERREEVPELVQDSEVSPAFEAVIRIRDTGRGIDPAALPSLFDLFYQVDRNLDRAEGGLGIGLAVVRGLVELHGGKVTARSAGLGQGSEFCVRLPCLPLASTEPRPPGAECKAKSAPRQRILIVDDNRDAADSLAFLFELEGHEVSVAYDGLKGLELALHFRPETVFLDIGLPGIDGYQVCRRIREHGLTDTLVVAITGYGRDEDRRQAEVAGFDCLHVKPVQPEALQDLLLQGKPGSKSIATHAAVSS